MQLIKRYIKRFVPVISVMALLISLMVVPAAASQIEIPNDTGLLYYDLLTAMEYRVDPEVGILSAPFFELNKNQNISTFDISWQPYMINNSYNELLFVISSTQKPSSVYLTYDFNGTRVNATGYSQGAMSGLADSKFYFYRIPLTSSISSLNISFGFSSVYSGSFSLYSCIGLLNIASSITTVDIYRNDKYEVFEGYELVEADPVKKKKLPYTFSTIGEQEGLIGSDFRVVIDGNSFASPYIEHLSLLLTTCSGAITSSVYLVSDKSTADDVTTIKHNLSKQNTSWGASGDYFQQAGVFESYATYQVDTDLSGFDMRKYDLVFNFSIPSINSDYYPAEDQYLDFSLRSISYVPFVENTPWYKAFFGSFFQMMESTLRYIAEAIQDFAGDVRSRFAFLFEKLDQYFGNDGSLAQAGDQMTGQAQQIDGANQALNSVEKPSLDTGAMFDSYLNFDSGGLTILASMTSNTYVTQALIVVFTFALCGYVFFGKRR